MALTFNKQLHRKIRFYAVGRISCRSKEPAKPQDRGKDQWTTRSKWDVFVRDFAGSRDYRFTLLIDMACAAFRGIRCSKHHDVASDNLCPEFLVPTLPILPACGLQLTLDIKLVSLVHIFADDFSEALPSVPQHQLSPVGFCFCQQWQQNVPHPGRNSLFPKHLKRLRKIQHF